MIKNKFKFYCIISIVLTGFLFCMTCSANDINTPVRYKELDQAVHYNWSDNVKKMVENGIDINHKNSWGETPLAVAYRRGHKDLIKYLVKNGADTDVINIENHDRPILHHFVLENDKDMVKFLIENGADPNKKDQLNYTALLFAVDKNNHEMVKYLIENGADPNIRHKYNKRSAIDNAVINDDIELVKYLRKHGARVNAVNGTSGTALSAFWNRNRAMLEYLVDEGAKIDGPSLIDRVRNSEDLVNLDYLEGSGTLLNLNSSAENKWGNSALPDAASDNNLFLVKYLIKEGADVNSKRDYQGRTGLMLTAEKGDFDIVKYLVDNKADVNLKDDYLDTALILAAKNGRFDIVRFLVEHGADLNSKGNKGRTPLIVAAGNNRLDVVKYLLKHGADINAADERGETALNEAKFKCYDKVVEYLQHHKNQ